MARNTFPRPESFADRRPVVAFLALALAFSWAVWIPAFLALPASLRTAALIPGAFGPLAAAAAVKGRRGGSVREWLAGCLDWRRPAGTYIVAVGLPVAVSAAVLVALVALTGRFDSGVAGQALPLFAFNVVFASLLGGGQEEFGWRGFALPRLQAGHDALTASLAVGAVWALWHAPLFAFGVPGYAGLSPVLYAGLVLGFSVVFTWFYNDTRGCVPAAVLLHGTVNAAVNVPPLFVGGPDALPVPFAGVLSVAFCAVALALLARHGRETLAAGPKVTAESPERNAPAGSRRSPPETGVSDA
jgi:membrane protease YdiL (CAAX protease family)